MKKYQTENAVDNSSADSLGAFTMFTTRNGIEALHVKLK